MCSVGTTSVRLSWRNALRHRWVKLIPRASRGQSEWRSLSGDFTGFLLYLGDMADDDGTNLSMPPCRDTVAAFVRCSKETVQRYYEAAEAAGLVFLRRDRGGRIAGYRLLMPFGDLPNWRACLEVLRDDARRINQQEKRKRERAGLSARADKCVRVHSSAREDELTPSGGADLSARDDDTRPHVTSRLSARADTTRLTPTNTEMAEAVGTATTPRARAPYDGPPPAPREPRRRPARRPRHPVAVPRPAVRRFTADGHPVIRPGTPEWEDFRVNLRAANGRGSEEPPRSPFRALAVQPSPW